MSRRITITLGICIAGSVFTVGMLFLPADDAPTGTDAYGQPVTSAVEVPDADITIANFAYGDPITVAAGSSIAVINVDSVAHTLTARNGAFDTGNLSNDATGVFVVPSEPGHYEFFCTIHPSMSGEVIVE